MLEIKVQKNSVYQRISGSPGTVLTEAAMMVCAIVRNAVRTLRENGIPDDEVQKLHTGINLMMLDAISKGVEMGEEANHDG